MLVSEMIQDRFNDRMGKMLRTNNFCCDMTTEEQKKFNFDMGGIIETSKRIQKQREIERVSLTL